MGIWSEEVVTQLKSLAEQGFSASKAATHFPGMTRNAAVGLAHRRKFHFLGVGGGPHRVAGDRPRTPRAPSVFLETKPKRSYRNAPIVALATPQTEADVAPRRKLSLIELTEATCKWPIGDPLHADFGYCGANLHPSYPYCASHCRMAYESPQERERARAEQGRPRNGGFFNHTVRHGRILNGSL